MLLRRIARKPRPLKSSEQLEAGGYLDMYVKHLHHKIMTTDSVKIRHSLRPLILILIVIGLSFSSACYAPSPANAVSIQAKKVTDSGGRLDWYKGVKHNLIAFDAIVDDTTKNTELYTMQPDGSDRFCVTCKAPVPKGFVGQPVWHTNT